MSRKPLDDMGERLGRLLPDSAREVREDFERNARSVMQQTLSRMDLVTREEFDAQAEVLARTRERLEAMAARVSELERAAGIEPADTTTTDDASNATE